MQQDALCMWLPGLLISREQLVLLQQPPCRFAAPTVGGNLASGRSMAVRAPKETGTAVAATIGTSPTGTAGIGAIFGVSAMPTR